MHIDRLLKITLTFSVIFHGIILVPRVNFNPFTPAPKIQEIAVRYIKASPQASSLLKSFSKSAGQKLMPVSEPFLKLDGKVVAAAAPPLPYIEQSVSPQDPKAPSSRVPKDAGSYQRAGGLPTFKPSQKASGISKPSFANSAMMPIKKKITLPEIETAKIDNPSYISYYQIVREKIRRSAYQNYTHNETGEVYVSFIISNDGYIKDVRLADDKTTANDYLKSVALRSIRNASPFPNFPKELDYSQLSFNIIISFEIE